MIAHNPPLTFFPPLSSRITNSESHNPQPTSNTAYHGYHLPPEIVLLAWARLVQAYTAHDEIVFWSDDRAVAVTPGHGERLDHIPAPAKGQHGIVTGVSFQPPTAHGPSSLWLHHRLDDGAATIHSNSPLAETHVPEISRQLQTHLHAVAQTHLKGMHLPPPEDPSPSIFNGRPTQHAAPGHLHQIFRDFTHDDRIAIQYLDAQDDVHDLSYKSLIAKSTSLAARIQSVLFDLGSSEHQAIIPVLAPQHPSLYVAEIAISLAGAAFCPLALDAPRERIKFVCDDTSASLVLTTVALACRLSDIGLPHICIDEDQSIDADPSLRPIPADAILSYVMYTSGSTGKPKGVMVSHAAVLQALVAHEVHLPQFSKFLQFAAPTFDVSIFEIYFTFMRGATLVCCDRQRLLNNLPSVIDRLRVDAAELTPTVAGTLLRSREACPGLRVLLTIGELLTGPVIQSFGSSDGKADMLYAMYGPTEAAIHCTLQPRLSCDSISGNIGRPLDTTSALILDIDPSTISILPLGQIGELAVGGYQLAHGYLNRPQQTAQAFVQSDHFGRIYRTGDKARLLPDGTLECLGRISDGQVKLRGQRMELGEVEAVILQHPGVQLAVASVIDDQLVTFLTPKAPSLFEEDVQRACRDHLPSFMVPSNFIMQDHLPRLASGKIDKPQLERLYRSGRPGDSQELAQPRDEAETAICEEAATILGHSLGPTDSFPRNGLDSLKGIRLASLLNGRGFTVYTTDLIASDCARKLADVLRQRKCQPTVKEFAPNGSFAKLKSSVVEVVRVNDSVDVREVEDVIPCSPIQLAMLTETLINPSAYFNDIKLEVRAAALEVEGMLQQLASVNAVFRSSFIQTGNNQSPFATVVRKTASSLQISIKVKADADLTGTEPPNLLRPLSVQLVPRQWGCVALFQLHHALCDGWSWDLLLRDMLSLLKHEDVLHKPTYEAFVESITRYLASDMSRDAKDFWRRKLADFEPSPLPLLNSKQDTSSSTAKHRLESSVDFESLQRFARQLDVHPQTFFVAAWAIIISGLTASSELTLGIVLAGRTLPIAGIERIVGPCITTLPLRLEMKGSTRSRDLLQHIQSQMQEISQHANLPLSEIKKAAGLRPGIPLFDTLLVWQESAVDLSELEELISQVETTDYVDEKILLEVEPNGSSLRLTATYKSDWVSASEMLHVLQQVDTLCGLISEHASEDITRLMQQIPKEHLSFVQSDYVNQRLSTLHAFAEEWAERDPGRPAVEFVMPGRDGLNEPASKLSYHELNQQANRLAAAIEQEGIQQDDVVCILLEKSAELYVAELAVSKIGATFLPISPETPSDRVRAIIKIAAAHLCLVQDQTMSILKNGEDVHCLDVGALARTEYPAASDISAPYRPKSLAYIIFTSGSTGVPKGVAITQKSVSSNIETLSKLYPDLDSQGRYLQSCSQAFDVSIFDIFYTWCKGFCLVSAPKDVLYHNIEQFIDKQRITHLSMTSTVAAMVNPVKVPTVEMLISAGEAMTDSVLRTWRCRRLYNAYGPSEMTNVCTLQAYDDHYELPQASMIGIPLPNTSAFILHPQDDNLSMLPKGAVGELCFGGPQVFAGYLPQEQLTQEKVVGHPDYGRIYRTGDLARMFADGSIMGLGRLDNQIKIHGQRVELDDIDSVISSVSEVQQSVTILAKDENAHDFLVSFWTAHGLQCSQDADIRDLNAIDKRTITTIFQHMSSKLPPYMCSSIVIPVNRVPMTTNDKVDRRQLYHFFHHLPSDRIAAYSQGTTEQIDEDQQALPIEVPIRGALSAITGKQFNNLDRNTSFYAYGIDSIVGIAFASELRDRLKDSRVDVGTVLRNSSIVQLAKHLETAHGQPSPGREAEPLIKQSTSNSLREKASKWFDGIENILPCTALQDAMLSAPRAHDQSTYFNTMTFDVVGDVSKLKHAWQHVLARQKILRTRFMSTTLKDFPYVQIILTQVPLPWNEPMSSDEVKGVHDKHVVDSARSPWTLTYVRSEAHLILSMHHALYDGIALSNMLYEVEATCRSETLPSPVSFETFLKQAKLFPMSAADAYWSKHLHDFEPSRFPNLTGKSVKARDSLRGYGTYKHNVDIPLNSILGSCREQQATLLSVCQNAWAKLLQSYLGSTDICFGNVVSGRSLPLEGVERLVAPCFNTLPVRVLFDDEATNHDITKSLMSINADHLQWQFTPLRRIQAQSKLEERHVFDTLIILQQHSDDLDDSIWRITEDTGDMEFPLTIELVQNTRHDTISVILHYQRSMILEEDVHLTFHCFVDFLRDCLYRPQLPSLGIEHLSSNLQAASGDSESPSEIDLARLLHTSFESNAQQRPHALALDFIMPNGIKESWTFAELNARANGIARNLRERAIAPEDAVIIHISKSPLFYASVLGILKAGGAFTPFDPDTPDNRKSYMERELQAKATLISDDNSMSWTSCPCINVSTIAPEQYFAGTAEVTSSNLAYRLYTSGSTGRPKAVSVEHRNAVQAVGQSKPLLPWTESSRLLQFASVTFDMCYYDCFLAWSYGFCLCAASQSVMYNDLAGVINKLAASILDLTPSVASLIKPEQVPSVELLYCIGEALPQPLAQEWAGKIVNSYGPTEAAMCVTICPMDSDIDSAVIGRPFKSTKFLVVTQAGAAVPIFGIGELYIGGAQVARAYHANEDMTRKHFVELDGERFYRTGDKVRQLGNGSFEFISRTDDQVKIRGLRVELDEVNSVIRANDAQVFEVVSQVFRATQTSKEQLVTFLSLKTERGEEEATAVARSICQQRLPAYMVPSTFIIVGRLPLSAAGKVDKRHLLDIFRCHADIRISNEPSQQLSADQEVVAKVLADLAGSNTEAMQPETTIHQLGLDSISAVQVARELRKEGFLVEATDVLRVLTVAGIAAAASRSSTTALDSRMPPQFDFVAFEQRHLAEICARAQIKRTSVARLRPSTPFQAGALAQSHHTRGEAYFNHLSLVFEFSKLPEDIADALDYLVDRYEMLRTGFVSLDDKAHPFAMVTYRARAAKVHIVSDDKADVSTWMQNAAQACLTELHHPVWSVLIQARHQITEVHLCIHHALYDAASLLMILDDLNAVLNDQILADHLDDIDGTLSQILRGAEDTSDAESWWRSHQAQAVLNKFPVLTPMKTAPGRQLTIDLHSSSSHSALENSCKRHSITLATASQAAWARLLSAYTSESIVTFGNVLSGRITEASASTAFPCITTVPILVDCSQSDEELLQYLLNFNAQTQQHQFAPLNQVQRWLGLSDGPLFDSLFAYQKQAWNDSRRSFSLLDSKATVEYPLSLEVEPGPNDRLVYRLTFLEERIPHQQALLMLQQLDSIMLSLLTSQELSVADRGTDLWSVSPPKERRIASETDLLHEFMEQCAAQVPNKIALEFVYSMTTDSIERRRWTYEQVNVAGNQIANFLFKRGVRQGSLVALCFDKCPEASFAMLGILKAGCGFVAIDNEAPDARKAFIVEDSEAAAILTMSDLASSLTSDRRVPIYAIDVIDLSNTSAHSPDLEHQIQPSDTSYCLYTSGTTGTPKGCNLSHDNAVQALLMFQRLFRWNENGRWLQFAGYHFDVSVLEHFWTWSVGLCMVGIPREVLFEDLGGNIGRLGITHIDLTPALAQTVDPSDIPSLCTNDSVFITGGEALRDDIIAKWGPYQTIYNGYGPTEATIGCTMYPRVPVDGKASNIGRQFDNVGALVLKSGSKESVLKGAPGELCVYGPLVAKGYLNRAEKTAECFQDIKVNGRPERMYRTGDLVRLLHDGTFAFIGRADDQVKLRGQRIETREINAILQQSDDTIADVVTLKLKHPKQQKEQLVSFFSSKETGSRDHSPRVRFGSAVNAITKAKSAGQTHLPGFAVPTHLIPLTSLPLSANNKIDAKQLSSTFDELSLEDLQKLSPSDGDDNGPLTDHEDTIAQILAEYTGANVSDIHKSTNVFEVGLDSISVLSFARALRDAGFKNAHPHVLMKAATIRSISDKLVETATETEDDGVQAAKQDILACDHRSRSVAIKDLGVKQSDIECIAPCTPLQQGMISRALENEKPVYFTEFRLVLKAGIDLERLREAWKSVVECTQILRTFFLQTEDAHVQVVLTHLASVWHLKELRNEESMDSLLDHAYLNWWSRNERHIRHPLEIVVVKSASQVVLALHIFHALYDGNSLPLILGAVTAAYHGRTREPTYPFISVLPNGPLRNMEGARPFWLQQLQPLKQCGNITPLISYRLEEDSGVNRQIMVPRSFENCRQVLSTTHQALVQATWLATLAHFFGPTSIGLVVSGRQIDHENADAVIGPIFNTIPFCIPILGSQSWRSLVIGCHTYNVAALPYQHTALRDITKWARQEGLISSQPLFDNLLVFQKGAKRHDANEDIWDSIESTPSNADYALALEVEHISDPIFNLSISAQASIAGEKELESILDVFEQALNGVTDDPDAPISNTLSLKQSDRALDGFSNGHTKSRNANGHHQSSKPFRWTEKAKRIRAVIASMTGIPSHDIGATASILELGLDSVDAIKLSSTLKRQVGIRLSQKEIMRATSITRMCECASEDLVQGEEVRPDNEAFYNLSSHLQTDIQAQGHDLVGIEKVLPTTPLQEAMVAEMRNSRYETYFNHDVFEIQAGVDIQTLKEAWQGVFNRNSILRTSFTAIETTSTSISFAQIIHAPSSIPWRHETFEGATPDFDVIKEAVRQEMAAADEMLPPIALTLIQDRNSKRTTHMVLSLSHGLYDGWSIGLLHQDVQASYIGCSIQRPDNEPVLSEAVRAADDKNAHEYWQNALKGLTPTLFAFDDAPEPSLVYRAERISSSAVSNLRRFCRSNNVSLSSLTETAFALSLAIFVRKIDIAFGVVFSGRSSEESQEMMFPTMNTLPLRSVLHGSRLGMVKYTQRLMDEIRAYERYPLRKALAGARREKGVSRLFDALFLFQRTPDVNNMSDKDRLYVSVSGESQTGYSLAVEAQVVGDMLMWRNACQSRVFDEQTTGQILETIDQTLQAILTEPHAPSVTFQGAKTNVCELGTFTTADKKPHSRSRRLSLTDGDVDQALLDAIRSALAQVAQVDEAKIENTINIFGLGLDSISAIKVQHLLRKRDIQLTVKDMLNASTLFAMAKIAQYIRSGYKPSNRPELTHEQAVEINATALGHLPIKHRLDDMDIQEDEIETAVPATAGQTYMLCTHTKFGLFHPTFDHLMKTPVDWSSAHALDRLTQAWNRLISSTPILRTFFAATGDADVPYVSYTATVHRTAAQSARLPTLPCVKQDEYRFIGAHTPFIQLLASCHDDEDGQIQLKLRIHHALYDGSLLPMIMQRLEKLMQRPSVVLTPSASDQKTAMAGLSAVSLTTSAKQERKRFWTKYLQGVEPINIITGSMPLNVRRVEAFESTFLTKSDTSRLLDMVKKRNVSIQSLFLTVYGEVYARFASAQSKHGTVVGIYLANRSLNVFNMDLSEATIPTLNIVPLRIPRSSREGTMLFDTAKHVQDGITDISSNVVLATTSLHEIHEMTRGSVVIDTMVNFLSTSRNVEKEVLCKKAKADSVCIEEDDKTRTKSYARVVEAPHPPANDDVAAMKGVPEGLTDAYRPTLDVETTVTSKGELAMGLFCDEALLQLNKVQMIMDQVKEQLLEAIRSG